MQLAKYIPFTSQRRRHKLLKELTSRRHCDDDLLSEKEKASYDAIIEELKSSSVGRESDKRAETAAAKLSKRGVIGDWLDLFLVVGAVAFGLRALYFQPFRIPTGSMQPTLYGVHFIDRKHVGSSLLGANSLTDALLYCAKRCSAKVVQDGFLQQDSLEYDNSGIFGATSFTVGNVRYTLPGDPAKVIDFAGLSPDRFYRKGENLCDGFISLGDHLFVERFSIYLSEPKRGDVIIFTTEELIDEEGNPVVNAGYFYIKRLAALPGDTIKITGNQLYVKPAGAEDFFKIQDIAPAFKKVYSGKGGYHGHISGMGTGPFADGTEYTVPENCYFMLGDNSKFSKDSRFFGAVPRRNIMGRAFLVFWPFSRRAGFADTKPAIEIPTGENGIAGFKSMSLQ